MNQPNARGSCCAVVGHVKRMRKLVGLNLPFEVLVKDFKQGKKLHILRPQADFLHIKSISEIDNVNLLH